MTSINFSGAVSGTTGMRQGPPPRNGEDPMKAVAEKLGLSTDDLKNQLEGGKSLNDVAEAQGVSHDDLIAAIKAGMPAGRTSGTSAVDGTGIAEKIAAAKGRPQGPPPGGAKDELDGLTASASQTKLDRISALLDTDSAEVGSVGSAIQLVDLLREKGFDLSSLKAVLDSGDLLDVTA
ncbi:hypothetical protein [Actinoplanes sp. NPDC049118]|uniref:hypothetical protein n=1 Tax=Actinoplanes sp. NPDC049118 TaxID=3155769 RepID=UPI0034044388